MKNCIQLVSPWAGRLILRLTICCLSLQAVTASIPFAWLFRAVEAHFPLAEEVGFEPTRQSPDLPVFKTGPFSQLGYSSIYSIQDWDSSYDLVTPVSPMSMLYRTRHEILLTFTLKLFLPLIQYTFIYYIFKISLIANFQNNKLMFHKKSKLKIIKKKLF